MKTKLENRINHFKKKYRYNKKDKTITVFNYYNEKNNSAN